MYLSYLKWHDMTSIQDCNPEAVHQQRRPFSTGAQEHFICELCVGRSSTTFRTVDGLLQHKPVFQSTIVYTAVMILDQMIKFAWQHQSVLRGFNSGSSSLPLTHCLWNLVLLSERKRETNLIIISVDRQDKNLKQDWTTWHVSSKSEDCVQDIWYII